MYTKILTIGKEDGRRPKITPALQPEEPLKNI